eukprot:TRINITY_DN3688_c0_g1_i2.p3 TRINITY_DN3688_c0_g1~~TRINITY_DN3688_c0_g1_i2.p3  ORF type:complete len:114 (-),score=19.66 TRINITY_DN3688_c0_g1_i2:460-801(-)
MECKTHPSCLESQYCEVCDELVCVQYQLAHVEAKNIQDIILKMIQKHKEEIKEKKLPEEALNKLTECKAALSKETEQISRTEQKKRFAKSLTIPSMLEWVKLFTVFHKNTKKL